MARVVNHWLQNTNIMILYKKIKFDYSKKTHPIQENCNYNQLSLKMY